MSRCPYCGGPDAKVPAIPPMLPRRKRIYDTIVKSGTHGAGKDQLVRAMYGEVRQRTPGAETMLRVQICMLNKDIARLGQHISHYPRRHREGRYYLTATGS